jgi:hypothetical protein
VDPNHGRKVGEHHREEKSHSPGAAIYPRHGVVARWQARAGFVHSNFGFSVGLQITLAQRNDRVNQKQSLYQLTLQDLENAQKELEVATNLHDEDDEDDEDNLGFQNTDRSSLNLRASLTLLKAKESSKRKSASSR